MSLNSDINNNLVNNSPYSNESFLLNLNDQGGITYEICVDFENLQNLRVIKNNFIQETGVVKWNFPILSKKKLYTTLETNTHDFSFEIVRDNQGFKVIISSATFSNEADNCFQVFNQTSFINNTSLLKLYADNCRGLDGEEWEKFFWSMIEKTQDKKQYRIAAAHAITILKLASKDLKKPMIGLDISGADLSGAVLTGVDFSGSYLEGVNFELADLENVNFTNCRLKDIRFGQKPFLSDNGTINSIALQKQKSLLAVGSNEKLRIWDLKNYHLDEINEDFPISKITFSNNGKWLAIGSNDKEFIRILNFESKKNLAELNCPKCINCLVFSPNDNFLIGSFFSSDLYIWKINNENLSQSQQCTLPREDNFIHAAFSKDESQLLITMQHGKIQLFKNFEIINTWNEKSTPKKTEFFPDNNQFLVVSSGGIFTGSINFKNLTQIVNSRIKWGSLISKSEILYVTDQNIIRQYNFKNNKEILCIEIPFGEIKECVYVPEQNNLIVATVTDRIYIVDLHTKQKVDTLSSKISGAILSKNMLQVITFPYLLSNFNLLTGERVSTSFKNEKENTPTINLTNERLTLMKIIKSCQKNNERVNHSKDVYCRIMEIFEKAQINLQPFYFTHFDLSYRIYEAGAISDDSHYLAILPATSSENSEDYLKNNGEIEIWETQKDNEQQCVGKIRVPEKDIFHLAFGPIIKNKQIDIVVAVDKAIRNYQLIIQQNQIQSQTHNTLCGHTERISGLFPLANKNCLFSFSEKDKTVKKWNLTSNEEEFSIPHDNEILSMNIDSKRSLIVTEDSTNTIRLFDLISGKENNKWLLKTGTTNFLDHTSLPRFYFHPEKDLLIRTQGISIYVWKITKTDNNQWKRELLWRLPPRLNCKGIKIHSRDFEENDLSEENRRVIEQFEETQVTKVTEHIGMILIENNK